MAKRIDTIKVSTNKIVARTSGMSTSKVVSRLYSPPKIVAQSPFKVHSLTLPENQIVLQIDNADPRGGMVSTLADYIGSVERFSINFSTVFVETFSLTEAVLLQPSKGFSETVAGIEAIGKDFTKSPISEYVGSVDVMSLTLSSPKTEVSTVIESFLLTFTKGPAETLTYTERLVWDIGKGIAETPLTIETITLEGTYYRTFTDMVNISDVFGTELFQGFAYFNTFSMTEVASLSASKVLMDPIFYSEGQTFDVGFVRAETVGITEVMTRSSSKVLAETASYAELKFAVLQSYASGDYFAEDYVGTRTTI